MEKMSKLRIFDRQ